MMPPAEKRGRSYLPSLSSFSFIVNVVISRDEHRHALLHFHVCDQLVVTNLLYTV